MGTNGTITLERILRAVLALVLAAGLCVPTPALAAVSGGDGASDPSFLTGVLAGGEQHSGEGSDAAAATVPSQSSVDDGTASEYQIAPQAIGTIKLNDAWKKQKGGLNSPYTIKDGGTYELTADLVAQAGLIIDAPYEEVIIKFNGYSLTLDGDDSASDGTSTQKTMVRISAARSVRFDGTPVKAGRHSKLVSAGDLDVWGISSTDAGCMVEGNDLEITLSSTSNQQHELATHAVRLDGGALSLTNCTVNMLMGNQAYLNSASVKADEPPSAIFATKNTLMVTLADCTVVGEGPQGFALDDVKNTTSLGNAYAVYSQASSTTVAGGSYRAVSLLGNATCIYATSLELTASESGSKAALEADAGQLATGILSTKMRGVDLEAPFSFSVGEDYSGYADVEAALRSSVAFGFVFGPCATGVSAGAYPVLVLTAGNSLETANASGTVIGAFDSSLRSTQRDAVVSALRNALKQGCAVDADLSGRPWFYFDISSPAGAVAKIEQGDDTWYYPTLNAALGSDELQPGDTVTLLDDSPQTAVVSKVGALTIDLDGHVLASLDFSAKEGAGLVVKDGVIGGSAKGLATAGSASAAVRHRSAAPLTLEDVQVRASASNVSVHGVSAEASAGTLRLVGSTAVDVVASQTGTTGCAAYGVFMAENGPELQLDGTKVDVTGASPGVSAQGVYTTKSATADDVTVVVLSDNGDAHAMHVGGDFSASDSSFSVFTARAASSASAVWASSAAPAAEHVELDGCTFDVDSAVSTGSSAYSCLLGGKAESDASAAAWRLAGDTVLSCVGSMHLGANLGAMTLGSDFKLEEGSDDVLVISQARGIDDCAFTVESGMALSQMEGIAARFEAKAGSHYDGWAMRADAPSNRLAWRCEGDTSGEGAVELTVGNSTRVFTSFAAAMEALSASSSSGGATVKLLADLTEVGKQTVSADDLTIDLNAHTFTVRAGGIAASEGNATFDAVNYSGSGTMAIENGTLAVQVGSASELLKAAGIPYQGIALTGGGSVVVSPGAAVNVSYAGMTTASAARRAITLRGIATSKGSISIEGGASLEVAGAVTDGSAGAMSTYGIYVDPASDEAVSVDVADEASVRVDGRTAEITTTNTIYAEGAGGQQYPRGLREITVDPKKDAQFYNDIVKEFRAKANYDDPSGNSGSQRTHGTSAYYAQSMTLDRDGAWYDGLKLWAFSDEVAGEDVGKAKFIVPSHIFVGSSYDVLPDAYGIATSADSAGTVNVNVGGSVAATSSHGNAYAVSGAGAKGAHVSLNCDGASLSALSDLKAHPVAQKKFDLRDYVTFKLYPQANEVYYSLGESRTVKYKPTIARCVSVGSQASLKLGGATSFDVSGLDAAAVEAPSFDVTSTFSLKGGSDACSVANSTGASKKGTVFAKGAVSSQASLFEDAYGTYKPKAASGGVAWSTSAGVVVTFMVGDAVVARYSGTASINMAEPSSRASRSRDARQTYTLAGWTTGSDENLPEAKLDLHTTGTLEPKESTVYHAVYATELVTVPVSFTGLFDEHGDPLPDTVVDVPYGQTIGSALDTAGLAPAPASYTRNGHAYRFVGWQLDSNEVSSGTVYTAEKARSIAVTLKMNAVYAGSLSLRAIYQVVDQEQYVVSFDVDGFLTVCLVDKGQRPFYQSSVAASGSLAAPSKRVSVPGKNFSFRAWKDGDDSSKSYSLALPKATADARYVADWSETWANLQVVLHYKQYIAKNKAINDNGVRTITTTCKKNPRDIADTVVKIGDKVGAGGKIYTMKGWSERPTDREPIYDSETPIPDLSSDESSRANLYSRTYYAVYGESDHKVSVTFKNGSSTVGKATVSSLRSVSYAFKATKKSVPADKSSSKQFLGWALKSSPKTPLNSISTNLESLVSPTAETLTLYAVFGKPSVYSVRMYDDNGSKLYYNVSVKSGSTLKKAFADAKKTLAVPTVTGKYFSGWRTTAGKYFGMSTPVYGSMRLYSSHRAIKTSIDSVSSLESAVVTSTSPKLEEASNVAFSLTKRTSADRPIRTFAADYKYTILQGYDIRLISTDSKGKESVVTGKVGFASLKLYVGAKYKDAKVRAFWLGADENGGESVLYTTARTVDDQGCVSVELDNYLVGDVDEGGNFALAYLEGGSSDVDLDGGSGSGSGSGSGGGSDGGSDGPDGGSGSGSGGGSGIGSGDGATGGESTLGSSDLSVGGFSTSGLSRRSKSSDARAQAASASGKGNASADVSSSSKGGSSSGGESGADGAVDEAESAEAEAESEATIFSDWNSDAVVLVVLAVIVLAAMASGFWRLAVVRQRRNEAEAELPSMADRYSRGVTF